MDILVLAGLIALSPTVMWLCGESTEKAWIRRVGAVLMGLGWCSLTIMFVVASSLPAQFSFNKRWTGAVCDFVIAADDRLAAGDVDRVREEFRRFREGGFHESYEAGWFIDRLEQAADDLQTDGT